MTNNIDTISDKLASGDFKAIARGITIVENELEGYEDLLGNLKINIDVPVIGVTGPPGAGKSSLVNALLKELIQKQLKVAVVAVDPTSPFNFGSLLGDRLRMAEFFNTQNVFIRSMATRGSLGGLSAKAIEITDILKSAGFDLIIVESVGVGQSEVEIAGLADTTVVVLVPESGDEIQTFKSGLMEIADIFVVNKADREGADTLVSHLQKMVSQRNLTDFKPPILKAVATQDQGIKELFTAINNHKRRNDSSARRNFLLTEKAYQLIRKQRMKDIDKKILYDEIEREQERDNFNLYRFIKKYF